MSSCAAVVTVVCTLALAGPAGAGKKEAREILTLAREHVHPSGVFSFRTPEEWRVSRSARNADDMEASGNGVLVHVLLRPGELGYDSFHATCLMDQRLAGPMQTDAQVKYEYEYRDRLIAERRALDTAFSVRYDEPIRGEREWRQRTVTIVGAGQSLCLSAYAPVRLWKASPRTRELLDAIVASLAFR